VIEIALEYSCGCRWAAEVTQLPGGEEQVRSVELPCVPEDCQTCLKEGVCPARRDADLYRAVDWERLLAEAESARGRRRWVRMTTKERRF
jgi:hypothetical protein